MRLLTLLALIQLACASSVLESLTKNGIVYEEIAAGRLVQQENSCRPWVLSAAKYADNITSGMSDFARSVMKSQFYQSMSNVCSAFNVSTDVSKMPMILSTSHSALRFMDRAGIKWNVLKFERDLKTVMLNHQLPENFLKILTDSDLTPFSAKTPAQFSNTTRMFPVKCNVGQLFIEMNVCMKTHPALEGNVYAIRHRGQYANEEQAFVYYDVPSHIFVSNDTAAVVDMNKCKTIMGNFIYCFEQEHPKCDILTLANCNLMAVRAGDDFLFERQLGRQTLVATLLKELTSYGNATDAFEVTSNIFLINVKQLDEDSTEVTSSDVDLVELQLPSIHGDTLSMLSEKPIQLLQSNRKGVNYLSHKQMKQTGWEGFKNFFTDLF